MVKCWGQCSLSILLLSTVAVLPVTAETTPQQSNPTPINRITPFNLVHRAYEGYCKDQGIPARAELIDGYTTRRILPVDLVKCAIAQNRLPTTAINDQGYLNAVNAQLKALWTQMMF